MAKFKKTQLNNNMSYSTFIHSGIVNPKKTRITKENSDTIDVISMDVPLFTRILELSREEIKSDADLHQLITKIIELKNKGTLTMQDYESIVQKPKSIDTDLESIKRLAGI